MTDTLSIIRNFKEIFKGKQDEMFSAPNFFESHTGRLYNPNSKPIVLCCNVVLGKPINISPLPGTCLTQIFLCQTGIRSIDLRIGGQTVDSIDMKFISVNRLINGIRGDLPFSLLDIGIPYLKRHDIEIVPQMESGIFDSAVYINCVDMIVEPPTLDSPASCIERFYLRSKPECPMGLCYCIITDKPLNGIRIGETVLSVDAKEIDDLFVYAFAPFNCGPNDALKEYGLNLSRIGDFVIDRKPDTRIVYICGDVMRYNNGMGASFWA